MNQSHLTEVGESYFSHAKFAFLANIQLLKILFYSTVHGIFPQLFPHKPSTEFLKLYEAVSERKDKINKYIEINRSS